VSKTTDINIPYEAVKVRPCLSFPFAKLTTNNLTANREWDADEIRDLFETHRRAMVRAEHAGCGKPYSCEALENRGHKVFFVCPTNKLAQNSRENGTTLNQFFSVAMTETQKMSRFDDSPYAVIVFDEMCFASVRKSARIRYAEQHPENIIVATGDTDQLECIDLVSDQLDYDTYMNHCVDTIFPNTIKLTENTRLTNEQDKLILKQFKADTCNSDISVLTTSAKYSSLRTPSPTPTTSHTPTRLARTSLKLPVGT
jgi:hypothetical protein